MEGAFKRNWGKTKKIWGKIWTFDFYFRTCPRLTGLNFTIHRTLQGPAGFVKHRSIKKSTGFPVKKSKEYPIKKITQPSDLNRKLACPPTVKLTPALVGTGYSPVYFIVIYFSRFRLSLLQKMIKTFWQTVWNLIPCFNTYFVGLSKPLINVSGFYLIISCLIIWGKHFLLKSLWIFSLWNKHTHENLWLCVLLIPVLLILADGFKTY